nr:4'-phosphopantetheinyl transferase superfamily protein [Cryobacterium roopkundense]
MESTADDERPTGLAARRLPEETHLVGPEVSPNRLQSIRARDCARAALVTLGEPPVPIPRSRTGEPVWPTGIVGSLTHTAGYRAAIVARASHFAGLGIDAEPCRKVSPGVRNTFTSPSEQAHLARLPAHLPVTLALFCAKEAAFKAWFPCTRIWLGMQHAEARIGTDGSFTVTPRPRGIDATAHPEVAAKQWPAIHGRWRVSSGLLLAVAWIPNGAGSG